MICKQLDALKEVFISLPRLLFASPPTETELPSPVNNPGELLTMEVDPYRFATKGLFTIVLSRAHLPHLLKLVTLTIILSSYY